MAIEIEIDRELAVFRDRDTVAGEYVLNDRYKPHFRRLDTPAGHNLVMVSPVDHRHHKGLMHALVAEDVCWWEEDPGSGTCGVQEILQTVAITGGIRQELRWCREDGGLETYRETREITLKRENATTFRWTWRTRRESLRDHRLIQSRWSEKLQDGRIVNYHGLGVRLPWAWCFGGIGGPFHQILLDGSPSKGTNPCGASATIVSWIGRMDGFWSPPTCRFSLSQQHGFPFFILQENFPYLATGPTVASPLEVKAGQLFEERYSFEVADHS